MKRKDFIKGLGLTGLGLAIPVSKSTASVCRTAGGSECVLIPSETAGPFPLDLTDNPFYFRQDIREDREGVVLRQRLRIIGLDNCEPMANVRVNIWHCDKDGRYSGYNHPQNPGQAGLTYLRGYQIADANGEVEFITILPGWYTGRICHIHFQVYVSSAYAAISQLTYPIDEKNAIYADHPSLYTKGADPLGYLQDAVFADGYAYQLATLEEDPVNGGYTSLLEVTVEGEGMTGIGYAEREMAKQFTLAQNRPNPFSGETNIPFHLAHPAEVRLRLFDLNGREVGLLDFGRLSSGDYLVPVHLQAMGLPPASHVYQLEVNNANGIFKTCRLMTAGR